MSSCPARQITQLRSLPVEIIRRVLRELPTLGHLFAAIQVCRHMRDSYVELHRDIVLTIVRNQISEARGYRVGHIYREILFAIRHDFVSRRDAKGVLELGWDLFQKLQLEEILIPLGSALAQTCWTQGYQAAATTLLESMWHCAPPFPCYGLTGEVLSQAVVESLPRWQPALIPVGRRLLGWEKDPEKREVVQRQLERLVACQGTLERFVHTVEIQGRKVVLQPGRTHTPDTVCTICHVCVFQRKLDQNSRPRGAIVWRFDPAEQPYPLIDPDDFDRSDLIPLSCMTR
ncbi:hypothetical protein F4809DRAFT_588922 [Biscogniauxia mediterranea]|nr:hypothetical protein F4809DRAFT_588922 [Biscogniauxia mediterranea]